VFRYLRHHRLNMNVRQVEDERFRFHGEEGLDSFKSRQMPLEDQIRIAKGEGKEEEESG
jgi:hypothetical protein